MISHFPLNCRCQSSKWIIHSSYIQCGNCDFKEHFRYDESIGDVLSRMKRQGSFFLNKDMGKCDFTVPISVYDKQYLKSFDFFNSD